MINVLSQQVGDKYRILREGEHLPEEIDKEVLDSVLNRLKTAAQQMSLVLKEIDNRDDVCRKLVSTLMNSCGLSYDDGKEWHVDYLISELEELEDYLCHSEDKVPAYEFCETIFDDGYQEEWYRSNIYVKVLEDSEEKEVVREILFHDGRPLYRERVTLWENFSGGRRSKDISYQVLEIDDRLRQLIKNTFENKNQY